MFWKTKLERNLKYKGHSEKNDIDVWNDGIGKKVDTEFWLDVKWHVFCDMILKIEVLHKQNLVEVKECIKIRGHMKFLVSSVSGNDQE